MTVTTNPIETGVSIADHCYMEPLRVTVNAVVSDIKMPSASDLFDGSPSGRVRTAYQMLQQLQLDMASNNASPFSVYTGLRQYDNMVVVSLSATQDVTSASLLAFTAELQEVITLSTLNVTYQQAAARVPAKGAVARAAKPPDVKGNIQPKPNLSAPATVFGIDPKTPQAFNIHSGLDYGS